MGEGDREREDRPAPWTWEPRVSQAVDWLLRHRAAVLVVFWPVKALLNIDRWDRTAMRQRRELAAAWLRRTYLWLLIPAGLAAYVAVWVYITWELPGLVDRLLVRLEGGAETDAAEDIRGLSYAVAALLGALALLATVPFQLIKTWVNERQATTAEQGHITDRFTRAVEQLGAEKTVKRTVTGEDGQPRTVEETVPNIEVRLGAIYALERIARDSERDHVPIMETLCAYIRENANTDENGRKRPARNFPLGELPPADEDEWYTTPVLRRALIDTRMHNIREYFGIHRHLREDIRAILEVVRRREDRQKELEIGASPREYVELIEKMRKKLGWNTIPSVYIEMSQVNLQEFDLMGIRLDGIVMFRLRLEGSTINFGRVNSSIVINCNFIGARLIESHMQETLILYSDFEGTYLMDAVIDKSALLDSNFTGSNLKGASMHRAFIAGSNFEQASLQNVNFNGATFFLAKMNEADMSGVKFRDAVFSNWTCARASLRSADFTGAKRLDPKSLNSAFGVRSGIGRTILPEGVPYPEHWHSAAEAERDGPEHRKAYDAAYRAWLASLPPKD